MKYLIVVLAVLYGSLNLFSQRGKDGVGNITTAAAIVNLYTPLTANASAGATSISVASSAGISAGDLVFIIQMQGARVNAGKDTIYPDVASSLPTNNTFGNITNYYNAGNNEYAQVNSVPNGTSLVLDCGLQKNYTATGNVQVIRVPRYTTLTVSGAGYITCPAWNGSTGGVTAVEVLGNTTLSSTPSFSVVGKGFRGGYIEEATTFGGNKYGSINAIQGAYKGESIAGDTNVYKALFSGVFARGAVANGGGGGDAHNAGGGGGSNAGALASYDGYGNPVAGYTAYWNNESAGFATHTSSGGGRGGYSFSANNANLATTPLGNSAWGGDHRDNVGGLGGHPLDYSTGRLFIGGGGGSGDSNDGYDRPAPNGGGMVYVLCYGNISGAGTIVADGGAALGTDNSTPGCSGKDGAAGGGGGGTIILNVVGTVNLTAATALSAKGGKGGDQLFGAFCTSTDGYGSGGGGGGGYIAVSGTMPSNSVAGGANGIVAGNQSSIASTFPPNGATMGGAGSTGTVSTPTLAVSSPTICTSQAATLTATSSNTTATINWYNAASGGSAIASGGTYTTPSYTAAGTYTVYAGSCPGTYRLPVIITVNSGLNLTVNSPTICAGQTATLTASGGVTYTWTPGGANTASITVSPAATAVYTVNAVNGSCSGTATSTVTVLSQPTVSVASVTVCSGRSATLSATGATAYTWTPGGQTTSSIVITPTTNATYSVTGSNGSCTNTTSANVTVVTTPTISVTSATICTGQTATLTASGATTYTWNPGGATGSTHTLSPVASSVYTVVGATASCTAQATGSVTVSPGLSLTVNSPTICAGQTATLTASGGVTYTWTPGGANTASITVSPAATAVYTVNAVNGSCSGTATSTVTVLSQPTVSVASVTVCSGSSATLSATGATAYTWAPGGQTTSSIVITPTTNATYSVTGSNGSCTSTTSANVTVVGTPTISVTSATICAGQTATLTATGATTYTWNPGGTTGGSYTVAPSASSVYTVVGTTASCTAQATGSVTVSPGVTVTVNSPTICAGNSATLSASGATAYTWTPGGATTPSISVNPAATTVYTVNATNGSCFGVNTTTVTITPLPVISAGNATVCVGGSATLIASGATNYTWSPGGITTSTFVASPGSSTTTYSVTGSNNGCTNFTTSTVSVTPTPTISVASVTICPLQTATLTASGATTYTWSPGNTTGSTYTTAPVVNTTYTVTGTASSCTAQATASVTIGSSISITVNSPTLCTGQSATLTASGATSYTWSGSGANTNTLQVNPASTSVYTVSGTNGTCSGTGTSTVTVNAYPTLTLTATTPICVGQTATLTASGATTYTFSNGATGASTTQVSPATTTIYHVTGQQQGCSSVDSVTVTVSPTPTVTVNSPTVCSGQTATLTANGAISYTWNPGNATGSTYSVVPAGTSTYTVTGTTASCLSQPVTATVTVASNIPITVNSPTICAGQSATLAASGATTYTWSGMGSNSSSVTVSPAATTVYTVNGTSGTCGGSGTSTVSVLPLPVLTASASGGICPGSTATLTASGANTYTWSNGIIGSAQTVSPASTMVYSVTGQSAGCSATSTVSVSVYTVPTVVFDVQGGNTVSAGSTIHFDNTSSGVAIYKWTFCNGDSSALVNPSYTLADTGNCCITLKGVSANQCVSSYTSCVHIVTGSTITIPNVFTPNGDNVNDVFRITSTGLKDLHVSIYDRWGLKMYDWQGINGFWDGRTKTGIAVSAGTYFYILDYTELNGKTTNEKGYLSLIKD